MRRVLVVDDDKSVCSALSLSLRRQGCDVVLANSGPRGITAFESSEFELAIVDIFMPGMDGLEIIKIFRKRAPALPIIAMSGYRSCHPKSPNPDFLEMAVKLGAACRLRKPFGPRQLEEAINTCLTDRLSRAHRPLAV
jgi:CheY-like chemotaxis protein